MAACQGHSQEAQIPEQGFRGQTDAVSSRPSLSAAMLCSLAPQPLPPKPPPKVRLPNGAAQMSVLWKWRGHRTIIRSLHRFRDSIIVIDPTDSHAVFK